MSAALRITELEQQNAHLSGQNAQLVARLETLQRQLDWFKRQLFGRKSEQLRFIDPAVQGNLLGALGVLPPPAAQTIPTETVTYSRKKLRDGAVNETGLRFDDSVPVRIIALSDPALEAIAPSARELIGEKVTHRLAQHPGSYEVLKYVRPVYKILATQEILSVPAPANVLDKCVADVSLLAGMLADKFLYHLPLYRQHQRLLASGIQLSRGSLSHWAARAIDLLAPIYRAQCEHIRHSRVLAMDETPIKAGRQEKGKMRPAYFWPIYGEDNEIVFPYAASRAHRQVQTFLGNQQLEGENKLAYRTQHSEPIVQTFWRWCHDQCQRVDLLPSNPLSKALQYARARQASLQVFLSNPEVPIDTHHLERALRVIPLGRRNWLFCWTELGAQQVGIIQSLIVTCKLQGVDVYTYLVDVLQRVGEHPAREVIDLTPRVWKTRFSQNPIKSDLALAKQ